MEQNKNLIGTKDTEKDSTYTITIDKNTFHVVSKFQGTVTSSRLIYDLAVKKILYDDWE